jgi:hypothetical protein
LPLATRGGSVEYWRPSLTPHHRHHREYGRASGHDGWRWDLWACVLKTLCRRLAGMLKKRRERGQVSPCYSSRQTCLPASIFYICWFGGLHPRLADDPPPDSSCRRRRRRRRRKATPPSPRQITSGRAPRTPSHAGRGWGRPLPTLAGAGGQKRGPEATRATWAALAGRSWSRRSWSERRAGVRMSAWCHRCHGGIVGTVTLCKKAMWSWIFGR